MVLRNTCARDLVKPICACTVLVELLCLLALAVISSILAPLISRQHVGLISQSGHSHISIVVHLGAVTLATLSRDQDDTTCGT